MYAKATFLSVMFAGGAIAAPTSPRQNELEKRANWQEGKCEAHIALNTSNGLEILAPTSKWELNIIDNPGNQIGHGAGTNPAEAFKISTSKGVDFGVQGSPQVTGNWGVTNYQNAITLSYEAQKWNGMDCYKYIQKNAQASNGWRNQYDWWCQFDC